MRGHRGARLLYLAVLLMAVPWLKASPDGRGVVDANNGNADFLWHGDSPHALYAGWKVASGGNTDPISGASRTAYLDDRQSRGFTALPLTPCYYDHDTDLWGADGSGNRPFTGNDISTFNDTFWDGFASLVSDIGSRGMVAGVNPIWFGFPNNAVDAYQYQLTSQEAKLRGFGRKVGAKLASYDNVVYILGGDQTYSNRNIARQIALGILDADTGKQKLMGAWLQRGNASLSNCAGDAWHKVNFGYSIGDHRVYQQARAAYADSYRIPFLFLEAWFEGEQRTGVDGTTCTAHEIRRQAWWAWTSGARGWTFGNGPLWLFGSGYSLNTTGANEMGHLRSFWVSRLGNKLVPDVGHTVVTSGYGTDGNDDHATCVRSPDGSLVVIYVPTTGISPVLDMTKLRGTTNIRRYSTTAGTYTTFNGTAANTGTQTLTHPGGGVTDLVWVAES